MPAEGLPEYAALLAARHAAHEPELRSLISEVCGGRALEVLDVACGDGFYAARFAEMLGAGGRVTAVDVSGAFLRWAAACLEHVETRTADLRFVTADAERLPFPDESFDLVWCAQSLISLPDSAASLAEMRRVVRAGGTVGILENDRLHEMQMPWPVSLELALREAETHADEQGGSAGKPHAGRRLEALFLEAELKPERRITLTIDRRVPLPPADEAFVQLYLHALAERASPYLSSEDAAALLRLTDPRSPAYLPAQPEFWMTWTDAIVFATRE